jgi:hypothetical protein
VEGYADSETGTGLTLARESIQDPSTLIRVAHFDRDDGKGSGSKKFAISYRVRS